MRNGETVNVKVTYQVGDNTISRNFDDSIRKAMEEIGCKWYAQGLNTVTKVRDICFDLKI